MSHSVCRVTTLSVFLIALFSVLPAAQAGKTVDFQRDVRPILSDKCFQCHGPDEATRMAGLRMDTREGAFTSRGNGAAIVAGDLEKSLLYQRITSSNDMLRMPPAHSNKELNKEQIATLKRWIEEGASWDQHWSFRPLDRPVEPAVKNSAWPRNPIDRFILARLESVGLSPAPEADRRTLARRAALDVTGLPPEPAWVEAFVQDSSGDAYEKYVDRLLESEHWGEHRGRYWLDAARYGDTHGIHVDNYREMWPYRDWVIRAFNQNMPFDQFTVEQIAGDLLPSPTLEQLVATGFHRCNVTTNEAGIIEEEYEAIYAKDRADTTGLVWLGLTVGCATCHDHKFDPIAQKDFYSLTAFFRNTTQYVMDGNVSDPPPIVVVPRREDRPRWKALKNAAAELDRKIEQASASSEAAFEAWLRKGEYRSLASPLDADAEIFALSVGDEPYAVIEGRQVEVALNEGVRLGEGPEPGRKALHFADKASTELPNIRLDAAKPFSFAVELFMPKDEDRFVVASQIDPEDENRGWALTIRARLPWFHLYGGEKDKVEIFTGHLQQLAMGSWNHVTVTYDGSRERAGLDLFVNGEALPTQGSEYFEKIEGSILTDRPFSLGKSTRKFHQPLFFPGGAIADFRIFNRAVNVEEARLVSRWSAIEAAREKTPAQLSAEQREALRLYYLNQKNRKYRKLLAARRKAAFEHREIRRRGGVTHVMQEVAGKMPEAYVLHRGLYDQKRELVAAGTPPALPPMPASAPRNRMGLARWLVDDGNPLTPRVTVNRFWQEVFGNGLVKTSEDFGSQGEPPSHPELLDWLAVEFRGGGWDVKQLFRWMLTSAAYRQSAAASPEKLEKDRENRLLSRGPRFRMDAEMIRDYALASSGLLHRRIGGPSVKPYQPEGVWETVAMLGSNTRNYKQDKGGKLYRRSLYTFWKRSAPPASMDVFNAPTREHCTIRRERTNTPLQALVTLNDPQFVEAARFLAQRTIEETGEDFERRLDYMTLRVLARPLEAAEREVAERAYRQFLSYYGVQGEEASRLLGIGDSEPREKLPAVESAALTMVANQLLNLDEVLNK